MEIRYQPDALYPAYKTVRLEDKLGEDMPDQKRRIDDKLPTELLQWDEQPTSDLADGRALFDAAIDKAYPIPDSPHTSVMQRANDSRAAFTRGWQDCAADLARQSQAAQPSKPTDISQRLREYAGNPGYSHNDYADTMRQAAEEIERYYGGMLAWKKTAEKKDRDWNAERMGRVNDRIAGQSQATKVQAVPELRYTSDGALAECPCCGSLDVGGAHNTVHCYTCDLTIKRVGPLQNAIDAWNRRTGAAPTAQEVTQQAAPEEPAECLCPACQGSGEGLMMEGAGPDAYEVPCNCPYCKGSGSLLDAYNGLVELLAAEREKYLQLCGKVAFADMARPAPTQQAAKAETAEQANVLPPFTAPASYLDPTMSVLTESRVLDLFDEEFGLQDLEVTTEEIMVFALSIEDEVLKQLAASGFREGRNAQPDSSDLAPTTSTVSASDDVRQRVWDAVAGALDGVYYCNRVWSAWSVGTMSEDDFTPAGEDDDILDNVVNAVFEALRTTSPNKGEA
jgi:hypothetical protein